MNFGIIFKEMASAVLTDAEKVLLPAIGTAATQIAANPTEANAASVGMKLLLAAITGGSSIGVEALGALATEVDTLVQAQLSKVPAVKK